MVEACFKGFGRIASGFKQREMLPKVCCEGLMTPIDMVAPILLVKFALERLVLGHD